MPGPSTSRAHQQEVTIPPKVVGRPQKRSLNQNQGTKRKRNLYETASESEIDSDNDELLFATPQKLKPLLPSPKLKPRKFKFKPIRINPAVMESQDNSMYEPQETAAVNEPQEIAAMDEPQEIAAMNEPQEPENRKIAVNEPSKVTVTNESANENNSLFANSGLSSAAQAMLIVLNKEQILSKQRMDLMNQIAAAELIKKP